MGAEPAIGSLHDRPTELPLRRRLRKAMPPAERVLWNRLRNGQLFGLRFRRQHSLGPYVLDFYCADVRLALELDGDSHFIGDAAERDAVRQSWIEDQGLHVLRFVNTDIYDAMEGVLEAIARAAGRWPETKRLE